MSAARCECIGAVLVGGTSRRMGQPKHALKLGDGRTMLEAVADALRGATQCEAIALVGDAPELPGGSEWLRVADESPGEGPLCALHSLLRSGLANAYLVCPCDTPSVTADVLRRLLAPAPGAISVLQIEGETAVQRLPMHIAASTANEVHALLKRGERSLRSLLGSLPPRTVSLSAQQASLLHNINTLDDLRALSLTESPADER